MANCIGCNKNLHLFEGTNLKDGKGPYCNDCSKPFVEFFSEYNKNLEKANNDAKAAAWIAVCHLLCAEKVNIQYITSTIGQGELTWKKSKSKAIEFAKKAASLESSRDDNVINFFQAIISRAQLINYSKLLPSKFSHLPPGGMSGALFPHYVYNPEDVAVISGGMTITAFNALLSTLPGHEWLTGYTLPPVKPSDTELNPFLVRKPEVIEPLINALKDSNKNVRRSVAEAIEKFTIPSDPATLVWYFVAKENWDEVVAHGSISLEPLINVIKGL
jgi:hypothetical protein